MSNFFLIFIPWFVSYFVDPSPSVQIDSIIYEQLKSKEFTDAFVILRDQADLSGSKHLKTKEEKGRFVFNTLRQHSRISQNQIRSWLDERQASYTSFHIANGIFMRLDEELLSELVLRDDIQAISGNPTIPLSPVGDESLIREKSLGAWGLSKVKADSVWLMGFEGEGVVVAGQDTGYEFDNPAIKEKYRGYHGADEYVHDYNWHDAIHQIDSMHGDSIILPENNPCGLDARVPCDDHNHGTHTMGTMLGENDTLVLGLAPRATWIGCRCMERGYGTPFTYLECFEWFLAPTDLNGLNPDPDQAPHVINNSWGCPPMEGCNESNFDLLKIAIENLRAAGIVVVVSAGNDGRSGCATVNDPPGIYAGSMTIGATNIEDEIAAFSSRGPVIVDGSNRAKPDIAAPGVGIQSVLRGGSLASWSGTSMAGPHVAGAVALLISAVPDLAGQVEEIENLLRQTAVPLMAPDTCGDIPGNQIPNLTFGHGRLDIYAAVNAAIAQFSHVNPKSFPEIKLFPNPGSSELTISWDDEIEVLHILVFDALGRIKEKRPFPNANRFKINSESWPPGIYWVQLDSGTQLISQKFIRM